jgi:hypothetical protein
MSDKNRNDACISRPMQYAIKEAYNVRIVIMRYIKKLILRSLSKR